MTEGVFDESGEKFIIVDDWKNPKSAHRKLEGPWTGTTTFEIEKGNGIHVNDHQGSGRIRIPDTDEADEPAADQDEHPMRARAEPKPVWVRKSAGKSARSR